MLDMQAHLAVSAGGARISVSDGKKSVVDKMVPGDRERLVVGGVLASCDIPPGGFFWLQGLSRHNSRAEVEQASGIIMGVWLGLARGKPILFQCRRGVAVFLRWLLWRSFGVLPEVLRGSLRKDNPYPPLVYREGGKVMPDGDDDHILFVQAKGLTGGS